MNDEDGGWRCGLVADMVYRKRLKEKKIKTGDDDANHQIVNQYCTN